MKDYIYDDSLVVSPDYSRERFFDLFSSAHTSIKMYFQYLLDDELLMLLGEKLSEGIDIEIVLADTAFDDEGLSGLIAS